MHVIVQRHKLCEIIYDDYVISDYGPFNLYI
ncbi:hypothetical protein ZONE111905_18510 [Zobellia nedashkovskayae]